MESRKEWETLLGESLGPGNREAASELALLGDPRSVPVLLEALASPDRWVRRRAGEALAAFGNDGRRALTASLGDSRPSVRREAVRALGDAGPAAFDAVQRACSDVDATVRRQAVGSLGTIGDPRAIEPILEAATEENRDVRHMAAWALYSVGRVALPRTIECLKDGDPRIRLVAVDALGYAVNPLAAGLSPAQLPISELVPLLRDEDRIVRRHTALILAWVDSVEDPRPWERMLASGDDEVRRIAEQAQRRLSASAADAQWERRRRDWGPTSLDIRWNEPLEAD